MEFPLKTVEEINYSISLDTDKAFKNCISTDLYSLTHFKKRIVYPFLDCLTDIGYDSRYIYTKEFYPYHNTNDILIGRMQDDAYYFLGTAYLAKHLVSIEHELDTYGDTYRLKGFTRIANSIVVFYNNISRELCKDVVTRILSIKDYIVDEWRRVIVNKGTRVSQARKEFGEVVEKIFDNKREEIWEYIKSTNIAPTNMSFDDLKPYYDDYFEFVEDLASFSVERNIFNCNNGVIRKSSIMDDKYWNGHPTNTSGIIYKIKEAIRKIYNKIKYFIEIM